jgi:hypothetical protein
MGSTEIAFLRLQTMKFGFLIKLFGVDRFLGLTRHAAFFSYAPKSFVFGCIRVVPGLRLTGTIRW